jgi:hypothetical protein
MDLLRMHTDFIPYSREKNSTCQSCHTTHASESELVPTTRPSSSLYQKVVPVVAAVNQPWIYQCPVVSTTLRELQTRETDGQTQTRHEELKCFEPSTPSLGSSSPAAALMPPFVRTDMPFSHPAGTPLLSLHPSLSRLSQYASSRRWALERAMLLRSIALLWSASLHLGVADDGAGDSTPDTGPTLISGSYPALYGAGALGSV